MSLESLLRAREIAETRKRELHPPTTIGKKRAAVIRAEKTKMQRDFERFNQVNPDVYVECVRLARQFRDEGAVKLGMRMVWEHMRYKTGRFKRPEDERQDIYKLNDHYVPYYARLIMEQERDLDGIFNVRRLRSKDPITVDPENRLAA